ncbi:MAG: phage major capsid protein [Bacteroidales bacterium]|nr:phage major capsid protein [Candidatus Cryptobacteroides faecihippi]
MRTIAEIRKDLNAKVAEVKGIDASNAEATQRGLSELDALVKELDAANQVEAAEQRAAEQKLDQLQKKAGRSFSLVKFVRELSEGRGLTGLEAEVAEMGAEEYRRMGLTANGAVVPSAFIRAAQGQNAGTAAEGGNLVETMAARYVEALKEKLVVAQLGATVLTDLLGEVPVITSAAISADWGAEAAVANTKKANYAKAVMKPHRNSVNVVVTKDLLRQTSFDVENDLINKITEAHAVLLESAAIAGSGSGNEPRGILNTTGIGSVAMGTNGAAIDWKSVVKLETEVNSVNANRGKMAYLTNAKVFGALKTTEKAANSGRFIMEDSAAGRCNGYIAEYSNLVPANLTKGSGSNLSAMIFGNFQDLYIGQWGGLDIVVDPFTSKKTAEIEICLNAWNDVLVAEPKSFAAIKDIIA